MAAAGSRMARWALPGELAGQPPGRQLALLAHDAGQAGEAGYS